VGTVSEVTWMGGRSAWVWVCNNPLHSTTSGAARRGAARRGVAHLHFPPPGNVSLCADCMQSARAWHTTRVCNRALWGGQWGQQQH